MRVESASYGKWATLVCWGLTLLEARLTEGAEFSH
jgi:hypothetical protein